jgi:hypothetical protein
MMLSDRYLDEIRTRWEAVRDIPVEITDGPGGHVKLLTGNAAGQMELRVTRDDYPAGAGDVLFVGHAFSDIPRLLEASVSGRPLSAEEAYGIDMRIASASPGPWMVFLESDGGMGGSDVIRVSEDDSEDDMYLWMGAKLAQSAIYDFIGEARQDVPALLAAVRQ